MIFYHEMVCSSMLIWLNRATASLLHERPARVVFRWVKGHSGNAGNDGADRLANLGADKPLIEAFQIPLEFPADWHFHDLTIPLEGYKITTRLPPAPPPPLPIPRGSMPVDAFGDGSHRGRERTRQLQADNLEDFLDAAQRHDKAFWDKVREWLDPKNPLVAVPVSEIKDSFETRMNPPVQLPPNFDGEALADARLMNDAIPSVTIDHSEEGFFSRAFGLDEIAWSKEKAQEHTGKGTPGIDRSTYKLYTQIPSEALRELFNQCVLRQDAPHLWLVTLLAAILKAGKSPLDPESYRLVGMESCLLKMLTLLIDNRLRQWADKNAVLPDSQNGFRPGYRTNNNVFILRCAIERARAEGKSLYVVFLDISNAFPSTDLPSLWSQLYGMGVSGPIFDWLRQLYARMAYMVRVNGELSESFRSVIGVLTGDTASPLLWVLFMADLKVPVRPGDVHLAGRPIPDVEHADDCAMWSTDRASMQDHVNYFAHWCARKGLKPNVSKTKAMCFGPLPTISLADQPFTLNGEDIEWVRKYKYTGVTITSVEADIFACHYWEKATSAQRIANVTFAMESMIGVLPPRDARILYLARIDAYLTSACDVAIDVHALHLWELEKIQIRFIRRLLRLQRRSMYHILYSETGLMPLRYRRLILALRFLAYLISLPAHHYARCAFEDSLDLARNAKSGWVGDLLNALHGLDPNSDALVLDVHSEITAETVATLIKAVEESCDAWVRTVLDTSPKTWLLKDRVERYKNGSTDKRAVLFRHYLRIHIPSHRSAFLNLLVSNHSLAVERLRWQSRTRPYAVPREWRLCRFCVQEHVYAVEDETHAVLQCSTNGELQGIREEFWADPGVAAHSIQGRADLWDDREKLRFLVHRPELAKRVGKLIFDCLRVFDGTPMYIPSRALVEHIV